MFQIKFFIVWYGVNDVCVLGGVGNQYVLLDEYVVFFEVIIRYLVFEVYKIVILILIFLFVDEYQFDVVNFCMVVWMVEYVVVCCELVYRFGCLFVDVWKLFMVEVGYDVDNVFQQSLFLGSKVVLLSSVFKELLWDGLYFLIKGY